MMLAAAMVLAPNVRFAPIATEFMRRSEPTLCAKGLNRSRGRALGKAGAAIATQ